MQKTIEITIEPGTHPRNLSPKDAEELDMRMKAFEIAVRMNPALIEEFVNFSEPVQMASPRHSGPSRES
ncbi:hypothetical protein ACTVJH_01210 [Desulfoplanes sp. PS50]|jgi:hypothetical protein